MNKLFQRAKNIGWAAGSLALSFAPSVFAQATTGAYDIAGLQSGDPITIVISVVETILTILALIAVIIVIIAGFRLILSQGEDEQKDKAKKTIYYALAGLAIVLLANVIVGFITDFLLGSGSATTTG